MKLTEHFSLEELTKTSHEELQEQNSKDSISYLKQLNYIANTLEEVRAVLGVPLRVTSGFRNTALNKAVGGSPTSGHTKGLCADIEPIGISVEEAQKKIIQYKAKCPSLKKCIVEMVRGKNWLHIETKTEANQPQQFFITTNGKTYSEVKA